jgi:hypothetical protein
MGYTKTIELSVDTDYIANYISDSVADCIDDTIRHYLERNGFPDGVIDNIMEDGDFWNGMIEDLMPRLKKI